MSVQSLVGYVIIRHKNPKRLRRTGRQIDKMKTLTRLNSRRLQTYSASCICIIIFFFSGMNKYCPLEHADS